MDGAFDFGLIVGRYGRISKPENHENVLELEKKMETPSTEI